MLRTGCILLLLLNGISALYGGWMLMSDPTGHSLQLPPEVPGRTPFINYFVPGLTLFVANGVLSLVTAGFCIAKARHYGLLAMVQGAILGGWIAVQVLMIRELHWLHFVMAGVGSVLVLLGLITETLERAGEEAGRAQELNSDEYHHWV
jgi:hypothetical protein